MKYLQLCLIFSILFSLSLQTCLDTTSQASVENCKTRTLNDTEKQEDDLEYKPDACCYLTGTGLSPSTACVFVQKSKVSKYIKAMESEDGISNVSIDCSGKFLGLASLLILLFLA